MKKVFISIAAIISTMIFIACPLFYKPLKAHADFLNINSQPLPLYEDSWCEDLSVYNLRSLQDCINNTNYADAYCIYLQADGHYLDRQNDISHVYYYVAFESGDVTFENDVLTVDNHVLEHHYNNL